MVWFCTKFSKPLFHPEIHECNAKKIRKSCETCKYFIPPTPPSQYYPGDPMECDELVVGHLMTANPPVKKRILREVDTQGGVIRCLWK